MCLAMTNLAGLGGSWFAGLPIGMQLMGRPWAEADLLHAGSVLEAALAGVQQMPKVFYDPLYGKVA